MEEGLNADIETGFQAGIAAGFDVSVRLSFDSSNVPASSTDSRVALAAPVLVLIPPIAVACRRFFRAGALAQVEGGRGTGRAAPWAGQRRAQGMPRRARPAALLGPRRNGAGIAL